MAYISKTVRFRRPHPRPDARERTLEACEKFKRADEDVKRIAKELGLSIPEIVC